jgi:hypothetical protein
MSNKANVFIEWLDEQEKKFGYSDYEVAKQGKFSHSVLSRARSGIPPKWDICSKIAGVFNVSPITVIRKAGLLPTAGPENALNVEDWMYLISQLDPEDEAELRQIAEMKIERRKKDQSVKTLKPKKVG